MPFNREESLRAAEKALKVGKIADAIAEYARIVELMPRDITTANLLGDLYARVGQTDNAIKQYTNVAAHFLHEGFLPKASAQLKKIVKIRPDDEDALLNLGRIAAKQGLLADARSFLAGVAAKRRSRGDEWGADDILIELGSFEAADAESRMQSARLLAARGQTAEAIARLQDMALSLLEKEKFDEAIDILREAVHLVPGDLSSRRQLIALLNDTGQSEDAEVYLTREVAADDPKMLFLVAKAELETGRLDEGRDDMRRALASEGLLDDAAAFMRQLAPRNAQAAFAVAEAAVDASVSANRGEAAAAFLEAFITSAPAHVAAPLRYVEVCLEFGLDDRLPRAQAALADAYLASGQSASARVIAEDLAAAAPDDEAARARLVTAYRACGIADAEQEAARFLHVPEPENQASEPIEPIEPIVEPAVPDFDVYVYGQPSAPIEQEETEEQLVARLLAEEAAQSAPAPAAPMPEIDLTATLDSLDEPASEAEAAPLEDVFAGFRERNKVEDEERAEAALEEAELASALGQKGDAERLYREAAKSLRLRFRAASALARLLRDEGRVADAIEWFERAAEVPAPDRDLSLALMYDLGDALERHGESMRALAVFMELNADAGDYRGVAARVDRLARAEIGG